MKLIDLFKSSSSTIYAQVCRAKDKSRLGVGHVVDLNLQTGNVKLILTPEDGGAITDRDYRFKSISRMRDGRLRIWVEA